MKSVLLFVAAVVAVFVLRNLMDAGNEIANWLAFVLGTLFVTWCVRVIIRVR